MGLQLQQNVTNVTAKAVTELVKDKPLCRIAGSLRRRNLQINRLVKKLSVQGPVGSGQHLRLEAGHEGVQVYAMVMAMWWHSLMGCEAGYHCVR